MIRYSRQRDTMVIARTITLSFLVNMLEKGSLKISIDIMTLILPVTLIPALIKLMFCLQEKT